jgi:predicted subunit of tRNA(5-methylaminomethyl-2-thiouridylate) methyltransferase
MGILEQRGFETTASFINAILGGGRPAIDKEKEGVAAPLDIIKEGVEDGEPEALANLLRRVIDDQLPIERRYIELASAFERETSGTDLSDRLHDLRIEALAVQGEISELTDAMEERMAEKGYDPKVITATTSHVLNGSKLEDAAVFSAFLLRTDMVSALPDERLFGIAEQLVELGLPNFAADFLNTRSLDELPVSLDARLASSDRRADRLADLISAIPSAEGRDSSANEILNVAGVDQLPPEIVDQLSQETRDRVAWARSDWENVQSEGPERSISQLIVDLAELELADEPLTRAMEIQGKAAETRALIDQVLQEPGE